MYDIVLCTTFFAMILVPCVVTLARDSK